ncbi:MAG: stage II sporulation protein R, partial [Firmicutes bacterium]|nr:stage II sporulation protein R [Candidatus Caballimonas caccae]
MKKFLIIVCVLVIGTIVYIGLPQKSKIETEYLRIHIRANSNSEIDQSVKYQVKENIVLYLTPILSTVKDKKDAINKLESELSNIEKVADKTLMENGFSYTSNARIKNEEFPLRVYEDLTLESGFYDALILNLGEGKGDNWWCVVYPPLCFVKSNAGYIYKSKIKEIIENFYNRG